MCEGARGPADYGLICSVGATGVAVEGASSYSSWRRSQNRLPEIR
jgi:hypothetical protein